LMVADNLGAPGSDDVQIHVNNINHLPQVDAGDDQAVHPGDHVTLTGTATDLDGALADVHWEQIAGPSVALSDPSALITAFTAPDGDATLRFRLSATDTCGESASDETVISVSAVPTPPPPPPPVKTAKITIKKSADRATASLGDTITYTYTATNSGEVALLSVNATDDKLGAISLGKDVLAPGESTSGSAEVVVSSDHFPGPIVNTVTVSGQTEDGSQVTDSASASVALRSKPAGIEITLAAQDSRGFPIFPFDLLSVGEEITYVYTITNTGESVLDNLALSDERLGSIPLSRTRLAPWGSLTGSFTVTITEEDFPGPFSNTVTVTATDPSGRGLQ